MKKLFLILFFIPFMGFAQEVYQETGVARIHTQNRGGIGADRSFLLPLGTHDSIFPTMRYKGRFQYNSAANKLEYNNSLAWKYLADETWVQASFFPIPAGTVSQYLRGDGQPVNFPSIPAAQVQPDWNASVGMGAILNKPVNLNQFINGPNYISNFVGFTTANLPDSADKRYVTDDQLLKVNNISGTNTGDETSTTIKSKLGIASSSQDGYMTSANFNTFNGKQAALVSGTNIKTVNGNSLLGTGNVSIAIPAQYGTSFSKEYNSSQTVSASTAVFDISGAGFASIANIQATAELPGSGVTNSPIAVITSRSLTSITVSLFQSKTTGVLILNTTVEGLETHSVANTVVHLTVKGN